MLRFSGITFIGSYFMGLVYGWFNNYSWIFDLDFLLTILLINVIFIAPAIFLHIEYFLENYNCQLMIDKHNSKINIKKAGRVFDYSFDEIIISKTYRSIYYKNKIDGINRWKATFSDYGYWYIRFKDDKEYFFTSLMIDLEYEPIIKESNLKYPLFPTIIRKHKTIEEQQEQKANEFELSVQEFIERFKNLSNNELEQHLTNERSYQKEAIVATRVILERRNLKEC